LWLDMRRQPRFSWAEYQTKAAWEKETRHRHARKKATDLNREGMDDGDVRLVYWLLLGGLWWW